MIFIYEFVACDDIICSIEILNKWLENRLPKKDMKTECMSPSFSQSIFNNKYQLNIYLCIILIIYHFIFF
jgi:hypothetical protein